jgi:hypothetical protein
VLRREATIYLKILNLNILMYCYIAITILRQHLKCSSFKRDYRLLEEVIAKQQAAHKPLFAKTAYARGVEEAPSYVKAKRL